MHIVTFTIFLPSQPLLRRGGGAPLIHILCNIVIAVMPFEVNSTWLAFPVYDDCKNWLGGNAVNGSTKIISVASDNVLKGYKVQ